MKAINDLHAALEQHSRERKLYRAMKSLTLRMAQDVGYAVDHDKQRVFPR